MRPAKPPLCYLVHLIPIELNFILYRLPNSVQGTVCVTCIARQRSYGYSLNRTYGPWYERWPLWNETVLGTFP